MYRYVGPFKRTLVIQDYIIEKNLGSTEVQVGCPLKR